MSKRRYGLVIATVLAFLLCLAFKNNNVFAAVAYQPGNDAGAGGCDPKKFAANYPTSFGVCAIGSSPYDWEFVPGRTNTDGQHPVYKNGVLQLYTSGYSMYDMPAWVKYTFTEDFKYKYQHDSEFRSKVREVFYFGPVNNKIGQALRFEPSKLDACVDEGGEGIYRLGLVEAKIGFFYYNEGDSDSIYSNDYSDRGERPGQVLFSGVKKNSEASGTNGFRYGIVGATYYDTLATTFYPEFMNAAKSDWEKYYTQSYSYKTYAKDDFGQSIYWEKVSEGTMIATTKNGLDDFYSTANGNQEIYDIYKKAAGNEAMSKKDFNGKVAAFCAMPERQEADFEGTAHIKYNGEDYTEEVFSGEPIEINIDTDTVNVQQYYEVHNISNNDLPPQYRIAKNNSATPSSYTVGSGPTVGTGTNGEKSVDIYVAPNSTTEYCINLEYNTHDVRENGTDTYTGYDSKKACIQFTRKRAVANIKGLIDAAITEIKPDGTTVVGDGYKYSEESGVVLEVVVNEEKGKVTFGDHACRFAYAANGYPDLPANSIWSTDFTIDSNRSHVTNKLQQVRHGGDGVTWEDTRLLFAHKDAGRCDDSIEDGRWQKQAGKEYSYDSLEIGDTVQFTESYKFPMQVDNSSNPTTDDVKQIDLTIKIRRRGIDCGPLFTGGGSAFYNFGKSHGANMGAIGIRKGIDSSISGTASARKKFTNYYDDLDDDGNLTTVAGADQNITVYVKPADKIAFEYGFCAGGAFAANYSNLLSQDEIKANTEFKVSTPVIYPEDPSKVESSYLFPVSSSDWLDGMGNRLRMTEKWRNYDNATMLDAGETDWNTGQQNRNIIFANGYENKFLTSFGTKLDDPSNKYYFALQRKRKNEGTINEKANDVTVSSPGSAIKFYHTNAGAKDYGGYQIRGTNGKNADAADGNTNNVAGYDTTDVGKTITQSVTWKRLAVADGDIAAKGGTQTVTANVAVPYNYVLTPHIVSSLGAYHQPGDVLSLATSIGVTPRVNRQANGSTAYATETKKTKIRVDYFVIRDTKISADTIASQINKDYSIVQYPDESTICKKATNLGVSCNLVSREEDQIASDSDDIITTTDNISFDRTYTTTIPDLPLGAKICYVVSAFPYDSHGRYNASSTEIELKADQSHALTGDTDPSVDYWVVSPASCTTIAKKPTMSIEGGAAVISGNVSTLTTNKNSMFGSWAEYGALVGGTVSKFGTGAIYGYTNGSSKINDSSLDAGYRGTTDTNKLCIFSTQTIANNECATDGGEVGGANNTTDSLIGFTESLVKKLKARYVEGVTIGSNGPNKNYDFDGCTLNGDGQYVPVKDDGGYICRAKDGLAYLKLNSATDKQIESLNISWPNNNSNRTLIINAGTANLFIKSDIISYDDTTIDSITRIPNVIIFAGNVFIDHSVKRIDAWIIASGKTSSEQYPIVNTVITCAANTKTGYSGEDTVNHAGLLYKGATSGASSNNAKACGNELVINGPVIANNLVLSRTYGAGTGSNHTEDLTFRDGQYIERAEVINLNPSIYLWGYNQTSIDSSLKTTYAKEIPSRL